MEPSVVDDVSPTGADGLHALLPGRLWAVQPAALDWHRLPATRDNSRRVAANPRLQFGLASTNHQARRAKRYDSTPVAEKDSAIVSLDWSPPEYGSTMLLVATDRALSIWQRVNGLADQYEKIVLNSIAANDIILARWTRPPSPYTLRGPQVDAALQSFPRKFYTPRYDGDQLVDNTRDPSIRLSFVTVSADGVIRWLVSTERMILASNVWTRAPSFSTAEHKIKSFDAAISHADTFFITHSKVKLLLCQTSPTGSTSICVYVFELVCVSLRDGSDPLNSRIDFSSLNVAALGDNPLTVAATQLDTSSASVVISSFDTWDPDVIYAIVKDNKGGFFLIRFEYRPYYINASDNFSWLVSVSKQSPSAQTNFKSWKIAACHQFSSGIPLSCSQIQPDRLSVAMADGVLEIRSAQTLSAVVAVPANPNPESRPTRFSSHQGEDGDLSAPDPKRRRLNDDVTVNNSPVQANGAAALESDSLVYMCPSPNNTCLATLHPSREVDMYHLAPSVENGADMDPLAMGTHIANMFELSVVRGTYWWDVLAYMLAVHRSPRYWNVHRIVILKLMRDLHVLHPEQQRYYWRSIETIKAAIYRSAHGMEVNFANSQIRLQLSHAVEVAKGLLRGSIQQMLESNPEKLFDEEDIPLASGEEKDSLHAMPSDIVKYIMQLLHFVSKSLNMCLYGLRHSSSATQLVGPSPTGTSPGFGTPGVQAATPTTGNQTPNPSNGNDLVPNDGLTDDNINPSWNEIEGFFSKDESPAVMDTTDSLDAQSTSVPKEGGSPVPAEDPVPTQTPSGLNPISPAAMVSTPSANGTASAPTSSSPDAFVSTPESIISSWPPYLLEPAMPFPIDNIEQYFALCDDSRHDVALALIFDGLSLRLQIDALLAFCAWCKVQASAHSSKLSLAQHRMSYKLLRMYERLLTDGERILFDQLDAHRNTISVEGSLALMDPLQSWIPQMIQQMANIDHALTAAKYSSRSQRDHTMQYLDISLPRTRFVECNFFCSPSGDPQTQSRSNSFARPPTDSVALFSKLSIGSASLTRSHDMMDVVTKSRLTTARDCRVCSNCNRVASFTVGSAPSASNPSAATREMNSWLQNWISRCPCCNGVWHFAF